MQGLEYRTATNWFKSRFPVCPGIYKDFFKIRPLGGEDRVLEPFRSSGAAENFHKHPNLINGKSVLFGAPVKPVQISRLNEPTSCTGLAGDCRRADSTSTATCPGGCCKSGSRMPRLALELPPCGISYGSAHDNEVGLERAV